MQFFFFRNHVLDALPHIGSTASYQLMRDLLLTDSVSKKMAVNWLKTLSFIQRPDEDTVETFYTILEFSRSKAEPEYTLSASSVIHSYCRYNAECGQNMRVKWIIQSLESDFIQIFNTFRGELRLYKRMIAILKGLGNIGILSEHFVEQLQKIIPENFPPLSIRLEAIFAFRRSNCEKYRSFFLDVYENFTINSEVRIAAYLQAMICPDHFSINKIKNVLKMEEINQVGSFVWSHLTNLAKSSSPVNIAVQSLLLNDDISTKFKLDIRKFSRNYQHTLFFDKYNLGTTTDMNIIFGTESYLPRMATLNLTTYLFGHSVNIFEITARAEGFEQLFIANFKPEKFFNQYSLFSKRGINPLIDIIYNWLSKNNTENDAASKSSTNTGSQCNPKTALKRKPFENHTMGHDNCGYKIYSSNDSISIKDVNDRKTLFHKSIEHLGYTLKYDYNNPVFQFGTRIFGSDLHFFSLNGIPEYAELSKKLDVLQQLSEFLSGKEIIYTKSKLFLDASYVIPLAVGLPLSIDLFGASSIDLRTSCKLDYKNPDSSDLNFDIKGMIKPTILVDMVGSMSSDMFYAQSGVKVKSTMYTNFEVAGELKVRGKKSVTFSLSLPQNATDIFTVHSELLKISRSADEYQTGIKSRRSNSSCTWPLFETATALKVCLDYSVPNLNNAKKITYPGLLLSGPMNFSVSLAKSDLTAKNWMFQYTYDQHRNGSNWAVLFFTPGSSFERSITANVSTQPEILNASLLFVHGLSKVSSMCQLIGTNIYRRFNFLLDTNGNRSLDFSIELKRKEERNVLVYKPKMLLAINGVNITGAVGTVRTYVKSGIVQNDMDFSFETRKLQMLIRGLLAQSEVTKSVNITVNYRHRSKDLSKADAR
ncbi:apolipophorins-like [Rhagoletis pomonella]|uniref:apolipophorins-like n=1 Tax=Rhagoletis pomonella TaxID=28610 RepID=UPI001783B159|nr:apolipophorins-like [Rhagoletis pomonella]